MRKKVLVTGADGFIGSHLVEALVERGYDVRAFVLYNSFGSWGWLDTVDEDVRDSLDVFAGDVRDPYGVKTAMQGCDLVLHLAALIAIPYSYHSPATYVGTNVNGTLNVVQAARELGVEKVVHTSTSEVYGTAQFVPITEEHPLQGQSPYSASKIGADQIAYSYYASFDTPVAIVRPFNTYGPRQSARAVIPTIITQIANGARDQARRAPPDARLQLRRRHGPRIHRRAESDASVGEVINIGSGFEISIGDLAHLIAEAMGVEIEIETDDERLRPEKSEVERLLASNEKAADLLGWQPSTARAKGSCAASAPRRTGSRRGQPRRYKRRLQRMSAVADHIAATLRDVLDPDEARSWPCTSPCSRGTSGPTLRSVSTRGGCRRRATTWTASRPTSRRTPARGVPSPSSTGRPRSTSRSCSRASSAATRCSSRRSRSSPRRTPSPTAAPSRTSSTAKSGRSGSTRASSRSTSTMSPSWKGACAGTGRPAG